MNKERKGNMGRMARFAAALVFAFAPPAWSQAWPAKPIRVIVNVPPGSAVDVVARIYAGRLGETLGQPVVIDYRPGGAGNIGVEAVAKSAPDGYTLLTSAGGTMVINSHLYKLNFDMGADLDPVAPTALPSIFLVVRPGLPARTLGELISQLGANPGKLNFGSPGSGTGLHIAAEMMLRLAKVQATHITYKGAAQMLTDLLGNQIDFMFDPGPAVPHIKSGKVRLLAVANSARSPIFPDTPTMIEAGMDVDVGFWHGVYAPAGTPRAIVGRLNRDIVRIMHTAEARAALMSIAAVPVSASAEEFTEHKRRVRERFGVIVREMKIRAE
jgi:tripartite-type tricarboxylate transporter receptor subunit TctC